MRFGILDNNDIAFLRERLIDVSGCKTNTEYLDLFVKKFLECEAQGRSPVCLLPKRTMCQEFNAAVMKAKGEEPIRIFAKDNILCDKNRRKQVIKKLQEMDERETGGLSETLDVAVKTRVMLRVNDPKTPGLVNGARGDVKQIVKDANGVVTKVIVAFDEIQDPQPIERKERRIDVFPGCQVYRKMFPLINSYAMTIHKSQSLSLPCVFIDLGREIFCTGMSYVGLSRCKSHEGLYLLNFCSSKVTASKKACIEYARMLQGNIIYNKGPQMKEAERFWYQNFAKIQAATATANEIKQEKVNIKTPQKKIINKCTVNNSEQQSFKRKQTDQVVTLEENKCKQRRKIGMKQNLNGTFMKRKNETNGQVFNDTKRYKKKKIKPEGKKIVQNKLHSKTSSKSDVDDDGYVGEEDGTIDYCPVGVEWQKSICNTFGWPFERSSRPATVVFQYGVHAKRRPELDVQIAGDGNCWYRTVAHLITGKERNFRLIKREILQFMRQNVNIIQDVFRQYPADIPEWCSIRYSEHCALDFIQYHEIDAQWADNVVCELTCCMLMTPFYIHGNEIGWSSPKNNPGIFDFWRRRNDMLHKEITAHLNEHEALYIAHVGRNHFQPAHTGLRSTMQTTSS